MTDPQKPFRDLIETLRLDYFEQRLLSYFGNGGLFNPELMEHDKVRDLLSDILDTVRKAKLLDAAEAALPALAGGEKKKFCPWCDGTGIIRSVGRDNDEIITDCTHCE